MDKKQVLKQIGIMLAALVVVVAVILVLTFAINGPNRMLTSKELALEQTRISLNIYIKQTEVALTSTAGLYLTLGVPFPTETPFIVPTSGALGRPTRTPTINAINTVTTQLPPGVVATTGSTSVIGATQVLGITSNPDSFWQGEWVSYYKNQEKLKAGILTTLVTGNTLSGEVSFIDGSNFSLSGTISADEQQVTGTYSGNKGSGSFYWQRLDRKKFMGNLDGTQDFCATQNVGMLRSRCYIKNP